MDKRRPYIRTSLNDHSFLNRTCGNLRSLGRKHRRLRFALALALTAVVVVVVAPRPGVAAAARRDLYVAVRADGKSGQGTADDPMDASTPEKFDAILARHNADFTFHYAAGTYQTHGYRFQERETANPGCRHLGAGIGKTVIQLVAASDPAKDGDIFQCDYNHRVDGFEIHDLTLDCNWAHNPMFLRGLSVLGAVNVNGSNVLLQNVKIIGFGTRTPKAECFPVFIYPGHDFTRQQFHNVRIINCVFSNPATGNRDGLSCAVIGADEGVTMTGSVIQGCRFLDVASDFTYSHAFFAENCEGNYVRNCGQAFYVEPTDKQNYTWIIRNNRFINIETGAFVNWHPGAHLGQIIFENNLVELDPDTPFAAAVSFGEDGLDPSHAPANLQSLTFAHNTTRLASRRGHSSKARDLNVVSVKHCFTVENVVAVGNTSDLPNDQATIVDRATVRDLQVH
jgi:hypothetical protein